jgi:phosphoglycolate phosphatase
VAFVGTVAGALVFGVLGVLLAMPVIASARLLLIYLYRKLLDREPFEPERGAQNVVRIRGLVAGHKVEGLIFDLDGTLAALDWRTTQWAVSYFYWLEPIAPAEQRRQIARRLMVALEASVNFLVSQIWRFGWQGRPRFQRLLALLDVVRGYPSLEQLTPLPEAMTTLPTLAASYQLALISTRQRSEVERFLQCAGLRPDWLAAIVTGEDVRNLLPHSEGLVIVANRLGLEPSHLLMVSDTDVNLRTARAMGMATAGVVSGLGRADDLRQADLLAEQVAALAEWL